MMPRTVAALVLVFASACAAPIDEELFEGDIVLDPEDVRFDEEGRATAPLFAVGDARLWPDATVPYVIDPTVTTPGRVRNAMAVWAEHGIRFVPHTDQDAYVVFRERDQSVCSASVGYRAGTVRYINLRNTARYDACPLGVVVHELGHTLGLWHEHTRPDRDEHVRILWDNIPDGHEDQFWIGSGRMIGPYDVASTMHYLSSWLDDGTGPSIVRLDGSRINHDTATLSPGDIADIRELYFGGADPEPTEPPVMEPDDGPPPPAEDEGDVVEDDLPVTLSTPTVETVPDFAIAPPAEKRPEVAPPGAGMEGGCSVGTTRPDAGWLFALVLAAASRVAGWSRRRSARARKHE